VVYFCSSTYIRFTAVSFQFSLIGNDYDGAMLLEDLDEDREIGECIDVSPAEFGPKGELPEKWFVVCDNLLFSKYIGLKRPPH